MNAPSLSHRWLLDSVAYHCRNSTSGWAFDGRGPAYRPLIRAGLIERRYAGRNGIGNRMYVVRLTDAGRAALEGGA